MPEYPDWQDFASWIGAPFVNVSQAFGVAATRFGPFRVDQWSAIHMSAQISGAPSATYLLQWWTDNSLTRLVGSRRWQAVTGNFQTISTDLNQGPVLTLDVSSNLAATTITVVLYPTNQFEVPAPSLSDGYLLLQEAVAVGAGIQLDTFITPYRGPVFVWFDTTAVAFQWGVRTVFPNGTVTGSLIHFAAAGGNKQVFAINLPARQCIFRFINNDAAGVVYTASVVSQT